ncbi:host-nuclease inhibitor Gam family protein [Afifella aestuarii]|uniref:host-nuclease inhibitor Gam family protein n=1 Tax=Afifella aestuarii TaxID=1909496 RepID=UPI000FE42762|nr:host-nuclease inhibitor Gam family protein [Afifella aestuarii]
MPAKSMPIKNDAACAEAIARIGTIRADLARIETEKAKAVAKAAAAAEETASPLQEEEAGLVVAVEAYCAKERKRLTENGKSKTAEFKTGKVAWRKGQAKLVIDPALEDKILDKLKKLQGFTKTKIAIDRSAVKTSLTDDKASPLKRIKGLSIEEAKETFSVTPTGAELAERKDLAA